MHAEAPGWVERRCGSNPAARIWVRADWEERLREAGLDRPSLLLRDRQAAGAGRGPVAVLRLRGSAGEEVVLKRYRRGGLAGRVLPDRYLGWKRFRAEFRVTEAARRRGLPVPEPLAMIREGRWGCFRLYGLTLRIPDSRNLLSEVDPGDPAPRGRKWLPGAARTLRQAHDLGLLHPDLHVGNLLGSTSAGRPPVHIVDLAGARIRDSLSLRTRRRSLARLRRSWEKACFRSWVPPGSEVARFLLLYCEGDRSLRRSLRQGRLRHMILLRFHRVGWERGAGTPGPGIRAATGPRPAGIRESGRRRSELPPPE